MLLDRLFRLPLAAGRGLGLPEPIEAPQISRGDRSAAKIDGECAILNSFLDANV